MERREALRQLYRILGKDTGYRVDPRAPSADERAEAKEKQAALTQARAQAEAAMKKRHEELLTDPEYQRLHAEWVAAKKAAAANAGTAMCYKFTVGVSTGRFFMVKAQGDSWEEVIAKLRVDNRQINR